METAIKYKYNLRLFWLFRVFCGYSRSVLRPILWVKALGCITKSTRKFATSLTFRSQASPSLPQPVPGPDLPTVRQNRNPFRITKAARTVLRTRITMYCSGSLSPPACVAVCFPSTFHNRNGYFFPSIFLDMRNI